MVWRCPFGRASNRAVAPTVRSVHEPDPHATFAAALEPVAGAPGVEPGTRFSARPGYRVGGKIFAMLVDDALVVKLPAGRCAALVAEGAAAPLTTGGGRAMREWVRLLGVPDVERWRALAEEALAFVRPA